MMNKLLIFFLFSFFLFSCLKKENVISTQFLNVLLEGQSKDETKNIVLNYSLKKELNLSFELKNEKKLSAFFVCVYAIPAIRDHGEEDQIICEKNKNNIRGLILYTEENMVIPLHQSPLIRSGFYHVVIDAVDLSEKITKYHFPFQIIGADIF